MSIVCERHARNVSQMDGLIATINSDTKLYSKQITLIEDMIVLLSLREGVKNLIKLAKDGIISKSELLNQVFDLIKEKKGKLSLRARGYYDAQPKGRKGKKSEMTFSF